MLIVTDQPYIYRQAVFRKGLRPMLVDSFGATLADKVSFVCIAGA